MTDTEPTLAAAEAVLLTGMFGSGKSTVGIELAEMLEATGAPYALIDLDYLGWFNVPNGPGGRDGGIWTDNLASLASNFLTAGVRRLILAGIVRDEGELETVRGAVGTPIVVVRLEAPMSVIERRLLADPTLSRAEDLEVARTPEHAIAGVGLEDFTVRNDRPLSEVAADILARLGW